MNLVYELKKVLIIKNKKKNGVSEVNATIYNINPEISNEDIYELAQGIIKVLDEGEKTINIYKEYNNVIDEPEPVTPPDPNQPKTFTEDFTVKSLDLNFTIKNKMSDEDVYGANLDGKGRKANLFYLGTAKNKIDPVQVPLEGFDTTTPPDPNGTFSFDSSSNTVIFKKSSFEEQNYRIIKGE